MKITRKKVVHLTVSWIYELPRKEKTENKKNRENKELSNIIDKSKYNNIKYSFKSTVRKNFTYGPVRD